MRNVAIHWVTTEWDGSDWPAVAALAIFVVVVVWYLVRDRKEGG